MYKVMDSQTKIKIAGNRFYARTGYHTNSITFLRSNEPKFQFFLIFEPIKFIKLSIKMFKQASNRGR